MSKFLVQLFLSMAVGVSAALGFAPNAVKVRQEVKASLRERVKVDLPTVGGVTTQVKTNASVSAQTQVKSVINVKENVKANIKVKDGLNAQANANTSVNTGGNALNDVLPQTSLGSPVDGSVTVNTQTNASVNAPAVDLNLKNTLKTVLDLNLNP